MKGLQELAKIFHLDTLPKYIVQIYLGQIIQCIGEIYLDKVACPALTLKKELQGLIRTKIFLRLSVRMLSLIKKNTVTPVG